MENVNYSDELQHHGIRGQKWGQRRYQNKDGSLTPAGQKRYNKEVEKLKKETAKVKAAEQVAANRKKTQAKLDRLDAKKQALEERKKALKEEKYGKKKKGDTEENTDETPEQRKERLLKSSDPKELYKYRDELSTLELNDRINRIDTENRLQSKIVEKHKTTGMEYMEKAKNVIDKTSALYKSVDTAYSTFANSSIAKAMGLDLPTGKEQPKAFNAEEFMKKVRANKLSIKEIQEGKNAISNINTAEQQMKQILKGRGEDNTNNSTRDNTKNKNQGKTKDKTKDNIKDNTQKTKDEESRSKENSNKGAETKTNDAVSKIATVKLDNIDYKKYSNDIKQWREKYDKEESPYSHQQKLDALYEIEKQYGISWRNI